MVGPLCDGVDFHTSACHDPRLLRGMAQGESFESLESLESRGIS